MAAMREMAAYYDGLAHWCGRMAGDTAARLVRLRPALIVGTRPGSLGDAALLVQSGRETGLPLHFLTRRSRSSAKIGRRARLIREKIIGHSPHGFTASIAVFCRFFHHWVLALPHQPARQQSRRVLLQPGIQQLRNPKRGMSAMDWRGCGAVRSARVSWSEEVRRRCGKELLRRGMFPPRKYFRNAA
jgi:hypothetical protein